MSLDAWLPVGFALPDGARVHRVLHEGLDWQIVETAGTGRALLTRASLAQRWLDCVWLAPVASGAG